MIPGSERRGSLRRRDPQIIRFVLEGRENEFGYGLTGDISSDGLWFYTIKALETGDRLKLLSNELLPSESAVVRWAREVEDRMFQVGIECIRPSGA